jgi:hypothetical protein
MPVAISASDELAGAETRSASCSQAPRFFGPEALVGDRLVDERGDHLAPPAAVELGFLHRDRDREVRDAVEEVAGAVERIDDPARLGRIALDRAAFLELEAPVGRARRAARPTACARTPDRPWRRNPTGPCG